MEAQISSTASISVCFDVIVCALLTSLDFTVRYTFSIMLMSGLCAGQEIAGILLSVFHCRVR